MRGIKNESVGCDDVGPQEFATIEVGEIEPEVFERERRLGDQAGDQLTRRDSAIGFHRWCERVCAIYSVKTMPTPT